MQLRCYKGTYFIYIPSGIVGLLSVRKADKVLVIPHRFQLLNDFNEVLYNKIEILIIIERKIVRGQHNPIRSTLKLVIPRYLVNLFGFKVQDELTPVLVEAQANGAIIQITQTLTAPLSIPEFMNLNFAEIIKYLNPKTKRRKVKDIQGANDFSYADTQTYSGGFQSDLAIKEPEIAGGSLIIEADTDKMDLNDLGGG